MGTISILLVTLGSFLSTNVDNFVLTTAQVVARPDRIRRIITGQLLGFALVVVVAVLAALALFEIPTRWVGLLGFVPLTLGVRGLFALRRPEARAGRSKWPTAGGAFTAALVTIGNSGDNLAVYIPLLRGASATDGALVVVVFTLLDVVLCAAACRAARNLATLRRLQRAGAWVMPVAFCVIGGVVLVRSGTFSGLV